MKLEAATKVTQIFSSETVNPDVIIQPSAEADKIAMKVDNEVDKKYVILYSLIWKAVTSRT